MEDLFTLHRRHDPETSVEAAESIADKRTRIQNEVLAYAAAMGRHGFTDEQLSAYHSCTGSTYRTRRAELTAKGLIVPTRRRAVMSSGRRAIVWVHREHQEEEA